MNKFIPVFVWVIMATSTTFAVDVSPPSLTSPQPAGTVLAGPVSGAPAISSFSASAALNTSLTTPLLIGGSATTSPLTLRSTSGVGTAGADIIFQTGTNGATEAVRITNDGTLNIPTVEKIGDDITAGSGFPPKGGLAIGNNSSNSALYVGQGGNNNVNMGWTYNATTGNAYGTMGTWGYNNNLLIDAKSVILQSGSAGNVGIGTSTPGYPLDVSGSININSGSSYLYNGVPIANAQTALINYYFGGSGNFTGTGSNNNAIGSTSFLRNTSGASNNAFGVNAISNNTTGSFNVGFGESALSDNVSGLGNVAVGANAGNNAGLLQTNSLCTFLGENTNSSVDGLTNSTALGNGAQATVSNQVVIGNSSVTQVSTSGLISAPNYIGQYTTTATASGTTTLNVLSTYLQFFTGSTTQTVTLPVASTLTLGQQYAIINTSSGIVTVQSSGANTIQALASNSYLQVTCVLTSGTGTASWVASYSPPASASATANTLALRDVNGNLAANNWLDGYTTTATAAGTTVLTVSSTFGQYFTGSTTQTVTLPVTSTLVLGQKFLVVNNSSGVVTVQSSGANTIQAMAATSWAIYTCILTSGTSAASWSTQYGTSGGGGSGTVNSGTANQIAYYGSSGTTVSGNSNGTITTGGVMTLAPLARTSGVANYFSLTIPADTGITTATESIGYQHATGTRTWVDGTVALQRENFFAGPTYNKTTTSATFTDPFTFYLTPPIAGTGVTFTRNHTMGIVDSTSAASAITGALVVATTLGTSATSVGIGGGNVNAGGSVTGNTFIGGTTSTVTNGAGHTLTVSSTVNQVVTGTTPDVFSLPATSTLAVGQQFNFFNAMTGATPTFGIRTSGNIEIANISTGFGATVTCNVASGTGASSWTVTGINGCSQTAQGDILYNKLPGEYAPGALPIGTTGQILQSNNGVPKWVNPVVYATKTALYQATISDNNKYFRTTGNGTATITNLALTGNTVTITCTNTLVSGQNVTINLLTGPSLFSDCNGTFAITSASGSQFTYFLVHANIGSGGATGSAISTTSITLPKAVTAGAGFEIWIDNNDATAYAEIITEATIPDTISGADCSTIFKGVILSQKYAKMGFVSDGVSDWTVITCNGDYVESTVAGVSGAATTVMQNLTTISLSPGDWDISSGINTSGNAAFTMVVMGISSTSLTANNNYGLDTMSQNETASAAVCLSLPSRRLVITSPTIIYLVSQCTYLSGTSTLYGSLHARRNR